MLFNDVFRVINHLMTHDVVMLWKVERVVELESIKVIVRIVHRLTVWTVVVVT